MTDDNRVPVQARIPPALLARIQAHARTHNVSLSRAIENLTTRALDHEDQA
jgi:hypothetical protein